MALPLVSIGETLLKDLAGIKGSQFGKDLLGAANFGSTLRQKLDQLGSDGSDPLLSQLAALLHGGTPLSTIIDRIAKELSNALASASGNGGNTDRRRVLERALASALAPPGTSPPQRSGLEQAATLKRRLGEILSGVTRELQKAGQQNRFSGSVLDADSARETPAQQKNNDTAGTQVPAGALPSAESILQRIVQQLGAASGPSTRNAAQPSPQVPQITTKSADVLGRMLARAASAQVRNAANTPPAPVPSATVHDAPATGAAQSPSQLFARLLNVIAQSAGEHASGQGGQESPQPGFGKSANAPVHHAPSASSGISAPAFAAAVTTASAPGPQAPAPAASPNPVDPQSVIEQVVKGIVMRNFGTTSELRMRLQPEHLGDVSLKLTVTGNTISANIVAQNADVRDMLLGNQQQLARTLAEAGLSLGKFSVDVSGGNPGFQQQHTAQHRTLSKAGALHVGALTEDDTWADERFGPPVLTGARSLVLNYLA